MLLRFVRLVTPRRPLLKAPMSALARPSLPLPETQAVVFLDKGTNVPNVFFHMPLGFFCAGKRGENCALRKTTGYIRHRDLGAPVTPKGPNYQKYQRLPGDR